MSAVGASSESHAPIDFVFDIIPMISRAFLYNVYPPPATPLSPLTYMNYTGKLAIAERHQVGIERQRVDIATGSTSIDTINTFRHIHDQRTRHRAFSAHYTEQLASLQRLRNCVIRSLRLEVGVEQQKIRARPPRVRIPHALDRHAHTLGHPQTCLHNLHVVRAGCALNVQLRHRDFLDARGRQCLQRTEGGRPLTAAKMALRA